MRQWCYVSGRLIQLRYSLETDTTGPGGKMLQLLQPLLSNNNALIDWFAHYDQAYDLKRVENHKSHDFWAYQAILALRGEWERLTERCEKVISDPPIDKTEQKYLADHSFYLALARGDIDKMQEILGQLVTSKAVRARSDDDGGYAADLISSAAVIYAKIAWRHGYQVKVDSPYIPGEWLPVEALSQYKNHYNFLN
nr:Imm49 family immunity protein [Ralstonia pickettii]